MQISGYIALYCEPIENISPNTPRVNEGDTVAYGAQTDGVNQEYEATETRHLNRKDPRSTENVETFSSSRVGEYIRLNPATREPQDSSYTSVGDPVATADAEEHFPTEIRQGSHVQFNQPRDDSFTGDRLSKSE